jgi:hypothetical protein
MKINDSDLPAQSVLQTALRKTTERLAGELALPARTPPEWSDFEWLMARVVAAIHGISPLLASTLRWQGPADWQEFLHDQGVQTTARHARIAELLRLIDLGARDAGIAIVALKGAELHALGIYRSGERPMGDVDLLVRDADLAGTTQILESLGFRASLPTWKHRTFVPQHPRPPRRSLGEHADNDLKIDLHDRIWEALPLATQDVTRRIMPVQPHPGLNPYPSTASLMIHLLLHAAGAIVLRNVRLIQLHDVALLSARMTRKDWDELLQLSDVDAGYWWAWPPLVLTARYYPAAVPHSLLAAARTSCPRLLRAVAQRQRLSDVSLSHLPIDAFPGIEWSQSLSEAVRYALRRAMPTSETLSARAELLRTRDDAAAGRWEQLSQWRRVLRWLSTPQSRTETLYPIRVALLNANGAEAKLAS